MSEVEITELDKKPFVTIRSKGLVSWFKIWFIPIWPIYGTIEQKYIKSGMFDWFYFPSFNEVGIGRSLDLNELVREHEARQDFNEDAGINV